MKSNLKPGLSRGDAGGPLSRQLITVRLVRLVDFVQRGSSLVYRRTSGFSDFEWRVLARVCETPPLSINELSELLRRGVAQVSRTVKKLVGAGLLKRENRGGGPGVCISPSPLGRTVYAPLVAGAIQADAELTAGVDPADLEALDRCIAKMTDNALKRLAREQALQAGEEIGDEEG